METTNSLLDGSAQLDSHNGLGTIIWQLEVVHTRHDAGQIIVCHQRRLMRLPHNGERWIEATETYNMSLQPRGLITQAGRPYRRWEVLGFL
jgi:hypothetical protein